MFETAVLILQVIENSNETESGMKLVDFNFRFKE
jgi:hypothetical protein